MIKFKDRLMIPEGYESTLGIRETEVAIKKVKDFFERTLAEKLNLTRVSAPLFVRKNTGMNDNLNGVERPVAFDMKDLQDEMIEIVHSLAKWKRMALHRYGFKAGEGLYTDMNAIRRDEDLDNLHSIYVDQWDWEKVIKKEDRNKETLKAIVNKIYSIFKETEKYICSEYERFNEILPEQIGVLASGEKHDGRAPDYDDWTLNGDILFWNPVLERAFELSSMGIRVDEEALEKQLKIADCEDRKNLEFHKLLLEGKLPYTVGGGIGQSRICMYFLRKAHIGEVQASIWPDSMIEDCEKARINLL